MAVKKPKLRFYVEFGNDMALIIITNLALPGPNKLFSPLMIRSS